MSYSFYPPIGSPRNGKILQVLGIARVSKPKKDKRPRHKEQNKELSLEAQEALYRRVVQQNYDKPFELHMIAGTGSGEYLDRKETSQANAAIESGLYDVCINEDLGRVFRRVHAYLFCELCEDHETRLVALNDSGVDTAREDWRMAAFFAVMRHESYNRDTAARIRRTLRTSFMRGGVCQVFPYGYVKPLGARHDDDVYKEASAQAIYDEWWCLLENNASYSEVADWLNANSVPTGSGCKDEKWTGRMVKRVTFNPILKGERRRNERMAKRVNKTGHRKSVKAPADELLVRHCPHLAFIEPKRYDRLIRKLTLKNDKYTRGRKAAAEQRKRPTKKWRAWPGQHLGCGVCGRDYYWGGHGQTEHMMCCGARDHLCWNGVTFDGVEAADRLSQAILAELEILPGFDATFSRLVEAKARAKSSSYDHEFKTVRSQLAKNAKQIQRVQSMILNDAKSSRTLPKMLMQLESEEDQLRQQEDFLKSQSSKQDFNLPSIDVIKREMRKILKMLPEKPEFCERMRRLVPSLRVYPYRLCDGGKIVLRAKAVMNLTALLPDALRVDEVTDVLRREIIVDLFDLPQRADYRERVVAMRAELTERQVAAKLKLTVTATQRAADLQRLMDEQGLSDPYVAVTEPPEDCSKLRRHRHKRYKFDPLPGFPDW